jgi:hypothetical protein
MTTGRKPPRFVPTLTEVVQPAAPAQPRLSQEQLVHRILQRIDLTLDRRLREAVARVVLEQTRQLAPALRVQIEVEVAAAVSEALAEEFGPAAAGGAERTPPA